ncbi:spoIID/LytB domain protein [Rubidibacter lacunae KORDI 51-2]|uniref:SpoIID/LytB domain protein n=1 Tax=Rubidibacter lacunae KORDI 51-2 TaxID=582515 RepID=U5DE93_9CHRO|nr:SpoIID/LytB domain-containing protein [Rubidibacter lacunae]ERN39946.1 spoIID/LytB domain protein [Rubidibacter lacunae KORDI 51-2]
MNLWKLLYDFRARLSGLRVLVLQRSLGLALLVWLASAIAAEAAVELRVGIRQGASRVRVGSSTSATVRDGSGRALGQLDAMGAFHAESGGGGLVLGQWRGGELWVEPHNGGFVWIGDRWYRGRVRLLGNASGVTAVNYVDIEAYLYSIVGAEMVASWPLEALRAQAVAARSYALYQRSQAHNQLFDIGTTTLTQVYRGVSSEATTTHQAADSTAGQVLTYDGTAILAAFHSSSGGHTEDVEDVWLTPLPYLRGVVDYDQTSPEFQWTKTFSSGDLTRRIGGVGNIQQFVPEQTTPRGRIVRAKIVGDLGTKQLSGEALRKALGLKSTLFRVMPNGSQFYVTGRGFGHGVGLSQWGAFYLAQQGVSYQQILGHYYQNARLVQLELK